LQNFIEKKNRSRIVKISLNWSNNKEMNLPELEQISEKKVKAIESNKKEPGYCIEYLNQPPFKSLKDSIIAQIKSCEQLLKNTKVPSERNAIEREILILVLILELLEY
jgi:hypothetical protein